VGIWRIFWTAGVALLLSSCVYVDDFSERAVKYNVVAEQAQQQALLLNIVRASLNRPMQFTTLSSITGTASETGNGTLTVPFGEATHRPKGLVSADVLGLSATLSAGPTFTVPVLDTQEFYQGELAPLTGQEYRFFLDEGITAPVLFYLFVDSIDLTVTGSNPPQTFTFRNTVGDDYDFDQFAAVADYLQALGLTVEQVRQAQPAGPPVTAAQLKDLRDIAALTQAGLRISPMQTAPAASAIPAKGPATQRSSGLYQIAKDMSTYRPCFAPPASKRSQMDTSLLCGSPDVTDFQTAITGNLTRSGGFTAPELAQVLQTIKSDFIASHPGATAAELAALPGLPAGAKFQLRLYMRSTEGILHYFGSIVARYLYPSFDKARLIRLKIGEPYLPYPLAPCPNNADPTLSEPIAPGYRCESLFVVLPQTTGSPLSVDYDGKSYAVPGDDKIGGRTMRMLDLAKQLLALHTSAQQLPASNVLNIVGGPAP
jgi:hypothetical protein